MDTLDSIKTFITEEIIGDGNCLYRCFSFYVYNTQMQHYLLRTKIVSHIVENWDRYKDFLIGDLSDVIQITNSQDYLNYMSQLGVYAGDAELNVFAELYDVQVIVYIYNYENNFLDLDNPRLFGRDNNENKLILLYSGLNNAGHYDVFEYNNKLFQENFKINKINNRKQKDLIKNMNEERILKKRKNNLTKNMNSNKLTKKRASDSIVNMNPLRLEKRRNNFCKANANFDNILKKRLQNTVKNMNAERLLKKRKYDQKDNMNKERYYKKQKIDNFEIDNVTYLDFGDMNVSCQHCNALYWKAERLKNNCCHSGKVKLPNLSKYPDN